MKFKNIMRIGLSLFILIIKYGLRYILDNVGSVLLSFLGCKWIKVCIVMSVVVIGGFFGNCMKVEVVCIVSMYNMLLFWICGC